MFICKNIEKVYYFRQALRNVYGEMHGLRTICVIKDLGQLVANAPLRNTSPLIKINITNEDTSIPKKIGSTHFLTITQPICYENYSNFIMLCILCFESFTLNLVKYYFQTY